MGKSKFIRNPFTFANMKRGDKHLRLVFISYPIALPLSSKKGAGYLFLLLSSKRESRKWLYFSQ